MTTAPAPTTPPDITIGVPAYRGQETIAETLRSIRDQTYPHFQVLISVDGGDSDAAPTAQACAPFLADPRFTLVHQPERLGWKGNLNWLMRRGHTPFFCYWQQDDLAATNYLETLRNAHLDTADLSVSYADVQWFGERFDRTSLDSSEGTALERVLHQAEAIHFAPLRGLIRRACLPEGDPIRDLPDDYHAETVFLAALARAGPTRRVVDTMYFKRCHAGSAHHDGLSSVPEYRRRRAWISMGHGLVDVARACTSAADTNTLLGIVADRLSVVRPGRGFFQRDDSANGVRRFVRDFLASSTAWDTRPLEIPAPGRHLHRWPVHDEVIAAFADEARMAHLRRSLGERSRVGERVRLTPADGDAFLALLAQGWSHPEPWGIWSDGDRASLYVPDRVRKLVLHGMPYGEPGQRVPLAWQFDDGAVQHADALSMAPLTLECMSGPDGAQARRLTLHTPAAVSPATLGQSADPRFLGFGLQAVELHA